MSRSGFLKIFILLLILGSALILLFLLRPTDKGKKVNVIKDNTVIETLDLNEPLQKDYTFGSDVNTVVIKDGTVEVLSANCHNQICVNSEPISEVGETIACLPHGFLLEVVE